MASDDIRYDNRLLLKIGREVAERAGQHDSERTLDLVGWKALSAAGLWKIPITKEYKGAGGTWLECVRCIDEIAKVCEDVGFLVTMLGHLGSIKLLVDHGTPEQIERWIPRLIEGEIAVTAMTEETGGSDLSKLQTCANLRDGRLVINGRKKHITNAPVAGMGMIAGRMGGLPQKKDITLFFFDFEQAGIAVGEVENNLGIRTSPTADIQLSNAPVDGINIIGEAGSGLSILYDIISFERALYGVVAAGLCESMLRESLQRTHHRSAFGQPIAHFQYVQRRITDMKMASVVCRTLTYEALRLLITGDREASIVCSTTKFHAGELLVRTAEDIVQIHGHLGFENNKISKYLRDATGMRIAGGTSDIQRINIFNQMLRKYDIHDTE